MTLSKLTRRPGRPSLTQEQRAEQRRHILDSARAAIRRVGPDVSVIELAAEAGISKPALYLAIGGRGAIAQALAIEIADRAGDPLAQAVVSGSFDINDLRDAIGTLVAFAGDEPEVYAFIARGLYSGDQPLTSHPLVEVLHDRVVSQAALLAPSMDLALLSVLTHGTIGFVFAAIESWQAKRKPSAATLTDALAAIAVAGFTSVAANAATKPATKTKK